MGSDRQRGAFSDNLAKRYCYSKGVAILHAYCPYVNNLRQDWSPEQVGLGLHGSGELSVSHKTNYQYIHWDKHFGGDLHIHLRCGKQQRKRYGSHDRRGN